MYDVRICVTHLRLVFSFSLGCLLKHKSFKFRWSHMYPFFLVWIMLLVSKNSLPELRPWRFSPGFPVIVLALPLRSVIHSEVARAPTPPAHPVFSPSGRKLLLSDLNPVWSPADGGWAARSPGYESSISASPIMCAFDLLPESWNGSLSQFCLIWALFLEERVYLPSSSPLNSESLVSSIQFLLLW